MIYYKTDEEIELIRLSSLLVGKTLAEVAWHIRPGVTTASLDKVAETFIRDHGAVPGFKGYGGFPGTLCVSVNDVVVHGIPGPRRIMPGDVVSLDVGVRLEGYVGDCARTVLVGVTDPQVRRLAAVGVSPW